MLGAVLRKVLIGIGVRKAPPAPRPATIAEDNDLVARYGLSYGEAADPISNEVRFEAERQRGFRRKH